MNTTNLKQRATTLSQQTEIDTITPAEVGGIMYDTVEYIESVELNGEPLGIRKTYATVADMQADADPLDDADGTPLRRGALVSIHDEANPSAADNGSIYGYLKPGWTLRGRMNDVISGVTAEGGYVILNGAAAGRFSFSCGDGTEATGRWAACFGYRCKAAGDYSLAGGYFATAAARASMAYGYNAEASYPYAIALGNGAKAAGENGVAIGYRAEAGRDSVAIGFESKATARHCIAIGYKNKANADGATITGLQNTADGANSFCCGTNNTAAGDSGFAMGDGNKAGGFASIAFNRKTECRGDDAISLGYATTCNTFAGMAIGNVNEPDAETQAKHFDAGNTAFCIGNGTDNGGTLTRGNAFKVRFDGTTYSDNTAIQPNADYAEMFEWLDGNPRGEDRVGRFVALRGDKITLAGPGDTPIGVISAAPSVIGDAPMRWRGKYLDDEWGRPVYEDVETTYTETVARTDGNGGTVLKEEQRTRTDRVRKINPDYDPGRKYVPREDRKEWDAVGLLGKLLVRQDGTLEQGGFCAPGKDGTATASASGCQVMKVINGCQAMILFK